MRALESALGAHDTANARRERGRRSAAARAPPHRSRTSATRQRRSRCSSGARARARRPAPDGEPRDRARAHSRSSCGESNAECARSARPSSQSARSSRRRTSRTRTSRGGHVELNSGNARARGRAVPQGDRVRAAPLRGARAARPPAARGRLPRCRDGAPRRDAARWPAAAHRCAGTSRARHALEGDWVEVDRIVGELRVEGRDRRHRPRALRGGGSATWGRSPSSAACSIPAETRSLVPDLILAHARRVPRRQLRGRARRRSPCVRRRDHEPTPARVRGPADRRGGRVLAGSRHRVRVSRATIDAGLFDLHWLDKCPLLAELRATRATRRCTRA